MLTPTYLTNKPLEECPWADYTFFYYKTCHYLSQVGIHDFEGMSLLFSPLPGKAIKLSFSTSPKTLVSEIWFSIGAQKSWALGSNIFE